MELLVSEIDCADSIFGPPRQNNTFFPKEEFVIRYKVNGVKTDKEGNVKVATGLQLRGPDGSTLLSNVDESSSVLPLGQAVFPGMATLELPTQTVLPLQQYIVAVSISDHVGGESASFKIPFTFAAVDGLRFIRSRIFFNPELTIEAPPVLFAGQVIHVHSLLIGFRQSTGVIETEMTMNVIDRSSGEELMPSPVKVEVLVDDSPKFVREADCPTIDFNAHVTLNRCGNFTIRLQAKDAIGTTEKEIPITVLEYGDAAAIEKIVNAKRGTLNSDELELSD